jgi:hypothetical protein
MNPQNSLSYLAVSVKMLQGALLLLWGITLILIFRRKKGEKVGKYILIPLVITFILFLVYTIASVILVAPIYNLQ